MTNRIKMQQTLYSCRGCRRKILSISTIISLNYLGLIWKYMYNKTRTTQEELNKHKPTVISSLREIAQSQEQVRTWLYFVYLAC